MLQLVLGQRPGPWQLSGGARMALLAIVTPVDTLVGVVLLQTGMVAGGIGADSHAHPRPDWALSAASDTAAAGTTMWIAGTGIMGLAVFQKVPGRHVFLRVAEGPPSQVLLVFDPSATRIPPAADARLPVPPHGAEGQGHYCMAVDPARLDD